MDQLSDLLLMGLRRSNSNAIKAWEQISQQGTALGLMRLMKPMEQLTESLSRRQHSLMLDNHPATQAAKQLLTLAHLAQTACTMNRGL
jgi:hypothetical protein